MARLTSSANEVRAYTERLVLRGSDSARCTGLDAEFGLLAGAGLPGVISLARLRPMACTGAQNVSMAPGAAPPGSCADRIVCSDSAARAHGWRYCLVRRD